MITPKNTQTAETIFQPNRNDYTDETRPQNNQQRFRPPSRNNNFGSDRTKNYNTVPFNRTVPYDVCVSCGQSGHWRNNPICPNYGKGPAAEAAPEKQVNTPSVQQASRNGEM